VIYKR